MRRTRRGTTRVARAPSREVALGEGRQLEQTWLAARPPCLPCKSGGHFIGVSPLRRRLRASPHGPSRVLGGEANGDVVDRPGEPADRCLQQHVHEQTGQQDDAHREQPPRLGCRHRFRSPAPSHRDHPLAAGTHNGVSARPRTLDRSARNGRIPTCRGRHGVDGEGAPPARDGGRAAGGTCLISMPTLGRCSGSFVPRRGDLGPGPSARAGAWSRRVSRTTAHGHVGAVGGCFRAKRRATPGACATAGA